MNKVYSLYVMSIQNLKELYEQYNIDRSSKRFGRICLKGHEFQDTGLGLRYKKNNCCVVCSGVWTRNYQKTEEGKKIHQRAVEKYKRRKKIEKEQERERQRQMRREMRKTKV